MLCGEIHPLAIHCYPQRKVRLPETGENGTIVIVVVFCARAKERNKQHYKRMLPAFVTPYCVIRRDRVMDCLQKYPQGDPPYVEALFLLGARDNRTIRRHLHEALSLMEAAVVTIAVVLAVAAFVGALVDRKRDQTALAYFQLAVGELNVARAKVCGARAEPLAPLVLVHWAGVYFRARSKPEISMTSVLQLLAFRDTS